MPSRARQAALIRTRQILWTAARTVVGCAAAVWAACALHAEFAAGRFNDDVEHAARWASQTSQEEMTADIESSARERGVAIDFLDVAVRDHHIYIRVNYRAQYDIGPYHRTYLYEKRASAPVVATR